jgi:predicted permease
MRLMHLIPGRAARQKREREIAEEIRFHLEAEAEEQRSDGADPEEAMRLARRQFGSVTLAAEDARAAWTWPVAEQLSQDLRYGFRSLRRAPGFAAAVMATIAVTLGPLIAIVSVAEAVLWRALPYVSPRQLVVIGSEAASGDQQRLGFLTIDTWRRESRALADIAFFDPASRILSTADGVEKISAVRTSPNMLAVLGMAPLHGRMFTAEEADQRSRVVLVSSRFQRMHLGTDDVIGTVLHLDGHPAEIVGVLPDALGVGGLDGDVWEPHTVSSEWDAQRTMSESGPWFAVGRLRPTVVSARARQELASIVAGHPELTPAGSARIAPRVTPLDQFLVDSRSRAGLWLLLAASACVMLIAVANVSSLTLARCTDRSGELATRSMLGAGPIRLIRQLLTEHLGLTLVSALPGLLIALALVPLIREFGPQGLTRLQDADVDWPVLAWTLLTCIVAGVLVGIVPGATMVSPRNLRGRGSSTALRARRIGRVLVASEFALALVLLASAGLLVRSWWQAQQVNLGFSPERVLSIQLSAPPDMPAPNRPMLYADILERVRAIPGVEDAGIIGDWFIGPPPERSLAIDGAPPTRMTVRVDEASESLFATLRVQLRRGRVFTQQDGPGAQRVAIVNEAFARRAWPGQHPLGGRIRVGESSVLTVVGVVADARRQGYEAEPVPQVFEPLSQNPSRLETLLVRTSAKNPLSMIDTVRAAVRGVNRQVALYGITSADARLGGFIAQRRFHTLVLAGFSALALLLATIGVFGLTSYSVATRTLEFAIRKAVGASSPQIVRLVVAEGLRLMLAGVLFGLAGAALAGRIAGSLLFGVAPIDSLTLIVTTALLIASAIVACYVPARRAAAVEPGRALTQG